MDEHHFELEMPFIVCVTNGGAYIDRDFVAGYTAGWLDATLERPRGGELKKYVPPELIPQIELLTMKHNWTMTSEPYSDEWTLCTFVYNSKD